MTPTLFPCPGEPGARSRIFAARVCRDVTLCVAQDFGLDPAAMTASKRGAPRVAFARQVAMYLAHVGFALSFETIGRVFRRDRTTVSHACRVIEDRRDDIWLDCRLAALELMCRANPDADREGASDEVI